MEDEWFHEEEAGGSDGASVLRSGFTLDDDLRGAESAVLMRAKDDAQGTVGCWGVVQMEAEGDHLLQYRDGWLDVDDAVFD